MGGMSTKQKVQLLMPEMGESVTEGTVLEWHVSEGDAVEEGQTMVEVSTDKVDAEVPAPAGGTVTQIMVGPDETVDVGKPLAEIDPGGAEGPEEVEAPGGAGDETASGQDGAGSEDASSDDGEADQEVAGTAAEEEVGGEEAKATTDDASVSAGK